MNSNHKFIMKKQTDLKFIALEQITSVYQR